jgi:hypothetical protein
MAKNTPQKSEDPYVEPPNSTVDDWHGQDLKRGQELADEAMRESGGDPAEAEERFDDQIDQVRRRED